MNANEMNLQATRCHKANEHFWINLITGEKMQRDRREMLALVISELAEALEGERKDLYDDHLPHRKMAEVEMADALIRILDLAGGYEIALGQTPTDVSTMSEKKPVAIFEIMKIVAKVGDSHIEAIWMTMAVDMIVGYCRKFGYDLKGAYEEKIAYNRERQDHKLETRRAVGGKKF